MDAGTIAAIIGAGGISGLLVQAFNGWRGMRDGSHAREKERNVDALTQRDDAVRDRIKADHRADREASYRRKLSEYASQLRRMLIEKGTPVDQIPPWPADTKEDDQ